MGRASVWWLESVMGASVLLSKKQSFIANCERRVRRSVALLMRQRQATRSLQPSLARTAFRPLASLLFLLQKGIMHSHAG